MTQNEKILDILKQASPHGVHSFVLAEQAHSKRVAARINDLKKLGYSITSFREELNGYWGCRYFLSYTPPPKPTYTLFDPIHEKKIVFQQSFI